MGRRKRFFSFFRDSWGIFLRFFRGILRLYQPRSSQYALRDAGFLGLRFYRHSLFGMPSGGDDFEFYVFTGILFSVQPPAAPSFVARRKIEEKGVPKGSEAALWILAFYTGEGFAESVPDEFALVPRPYFNQGWRSAYPHPFVPTAVRWKGLHSRNHPTAKFAKRWLFHKCQRFRRSTCSTERQGNKRQRRSRLNRVNCTNANS